MDTKSESKVAVEEQFLAKNKPLTDSGKASVQRIKAAIGQADKYKAGALCQAEFALQGGR